MQGGNKTNSSRPCARAVHCCCYQKPPNSGTQASRVHACKQQVGLPVHNCICLHRVLAAICYQTLQHFDCCWVLALTQAEGNVMPEEV